MIVVQGLTNVLDCNVRVSVAEEETDKVDNSKVRAALRQDQQQLLALVGIQGLLKKHDRSDHIRERKFEAQGMRKKCRRSAGGRVNRRGQVGEG